jgi:exopolysaccharide production protein ExoQ
MNRTWQSLEKLFAIAALVFFTRVLDSESLYIASEGKTESLVSVGENPLAPFLSLMQHSIFLIVVCLLFFRSKDTIKTVTRGKVIWAVVILVPLSSLWSNVPDITIKGAFAFIESCAFGLYLASQYNLKEQLRLIAWALGITSLISLFYTLALPGDAIENGIHIGAWRGPFIQKNIFARLLILNCLAYVCINSKHLWHKYLLFGGLALSLSLTILSQSKTALIVLVLLMLISLAYRLLRLQDLLAIPSILSLMLLTGGIAIAILNNTERILASVGKDITLSGRTVIWTGLIEQIKLRPWFGYGYMGFWQNVESRSFISKVFGTTYSPPHSHNGYLELVTSFGLIGAILFAITFFAIARRAMMLIFWERTTEAMWPILFLSFLVIYNFTEPTFIEHNSIFWIIYLTLAISRFLDLDRARHSHYPLVGLASPARQVTSDHKPEFYNYQNNHN